MKVDMTQFDRQTSYFLSREESDRIKIIKYIAMIFVVYIHSYAIEVNFADGTNDLGLPNWLLLFENGISKVIASCGVPLFFLLSAILLFKTKRYYVKTIKNKAKTILVPYLIWNTFWIVVFIVLQSLPFAASLFSENSTPILQSSVTEWLALYGIGTGYPLDYPLWFMRDLMVVLLFFPIIEKIADKFPKQVLFISIILLLMPVTFPFIKPILWFFVGACVVRLQIHITVWDNISVAKFSLFYIICFIVTLVTQSSVIDNLFIFIGIAYLIRVSRCIYDSEGLRKIFLALSEWTFMIYVSHELTLTSIKKICLKLLPTEPIWLFLEYLVLPIIVIVGCSIAGAILKRIVPKVYNVLMGTR